MFCVRRHNSGIAPVDPVCCTLPTKLCWFRRGKPSSGKRFTVRCAPSALAVGLARQGRCKPAVLLGYRHLGSARAKPPPLGVRSFTDEPTPLPTTGKDVGIDIGLSALITTSEGEKVAYPRFYRNAQRKLRVAQRRVARRKKGGNNRRQAVAMLQGQYERIAKPAQRLSE